jgi:hypothetical protein
LLSFSLQNRAPYFYSLFIVPLRPQTQAPVAGAVEISEWLSILLISFSYW